MPDKRGKRSRRPPGYITPPDGYILPGSDPRYIAALEASTPTPLDLSKLATSKTKAKAKRQKTKPPKNKAEKATTKASKTDTDCLLQSLQKLLDSMAPDVPLALSATGSTTQTAPAAPEWWTKSFAPVFTKPPTTVSTHLDPLTTRTWGSDATEETSPAAIAAAASNNNAEVPKFSMGGNIRYQTREIAEVGGNGEGKKITWTTWSIVENWITIPESVEIEDVRKMLRACDLASSTSSGSAEESSSGEDSSSSSSSDNRENSSSSSDSSSDSESERVSSDDRKKSMKSKKEAKQGMKRSKPPMAPKPLSKRKSKCRSHGHI